MSPIFFNVVVAYIKTNVEKVNVEKIVLLKSDKENFIFLKQYLET